MNEFFFKPNGGGPRFENWGLIGFLAAALGYSMVKDFKPTSTEVTFMDFINVYLAQNQVKAITIHESSKD